MNDKEALACTAFWAANPDARVCGADHVGQPLQVRATMSDKRTKRTAPVFDGIPHSCPTCRKRPGFYFGKFVFAGEEVPTCPNPHPGDVVVALVPSVASTGGSSVGR